MHFVCVLAAALCPIKPQARRSDERTHRCPAQRRPRCRSLVSLNTESGGNRFCDCLGAWCNRQVARQQHGDPVSYIVAHLPRPRTTRRANTNMVPRKFEALSAIRSSLLFETISDFHQNHARSGNYSAKT